MLQRIAWLVLALVHALPAIAALRPGMIAGMYGVGTDDPAFLLLHHRAALFGAVLVVCLWAAVDPSVRRLSVVVVAISMGSFIAMWFAYGTPPALRTIAIVDMVALPVLAFAGWQAFGR